MKKVVKKPVAKKAPPKPKPAPKKVVKKVVKKAAPKPAPKKAAPVRKVTPTKPKPKPKAAPKARPAVVQSSIKKIAGVRPISGRRSEQNKGAFSGATTRSFTSAQSFAKRGNSFSWTPAGVSIKKDGQRAVIKKKPYA